MGMLMKTETNRRNIRENEMKERKRQMKGRTKERKENEMKDIKLKEGNETEREK